MNSRRRCTIEALLAGLVLAGVLSIAGVTAAEPPPPAQSAAVADREPRELIEAWYAELKRGEEGHPWRLFAPGAIVTARAERTNIAPPGARGLKLIGPPFPHELIRRAEKFAYQIEELRIEGGLAKVRVSERGWIYAWAAKQTYENAAEARFVLERGPDGIWRILAFDSNGMATRPAPRNEPMPDLSPEAKSKRE
jgi:hypothetical protein